MEDGMCINHARSLLECPKIERMIKGDMIACYWDNSVGRIDCDVNYDRRDGYVSIVIGSPIGIEAIVTVIFESSPCVHSCMFREFNFRKEVNQ